MNDMQKMLKIYLLDVGNAVHIALAISGLVLAVSSPGWATVMLIAAGWISYLVQEHLVHRYIFHAPAPRNQFLFNLLYRVHYGHHDQIKNSDLLFTPMWFSLPLGLLNLVAVSMVLTLEQAWILVYGGAVSAYVIFEWCHLLSHFHAHERGKFATRLSRDHGRHHHINFNHWYTVSPGGQLVDSALGACPQTFTRLDHPRTCGLNPDDPRLVSARNKFGSNQILANRDIAEG